MPNTTAKPATYPRYDSLWHLVAMGVLTPQHQPKSWTAATLARPTRVAMIDTSVAFDHPNISAAINRDLSLDLFSATLGSFSAKSKTDTLGNLGLTDPNSLVQGLPHSGALLDDFVARMAVGQPAWHRGVAPATSAVFSAHGTAIAGLIGARPVLIDAEDDAFPSAKNGKVALPYCGVDPMAEIVSISTNFDVDPVPLILAFLYAEMINADVILLPRVIPDPYRTVPELSSYVLDDLGGATLTDAISPHPVAAVQRELWEELAELIVRISMRRPVVCAAGNANEEYGLYPANCASDDNGIIAVGAVNAKGWNCSYSPMHNLTCWAPSSDGERFDRAEVRLDEKRSDYKAEGVPVPNNNARYSYYDVISTDVPGKGGYAVSPYGGADDLTGHGMREFGSYFCRFGGTSAASAQVAGFLSLGQSIGDYPQGSNGVDAKAWLLGKCTTLGAQHGTMVMPVLRGTAAFPDNP
jgi:hypothetical protein